MYELYPNFVRDSADQSVENAKQIILNIFQEFEIDFPIPEAITEGVLETMGGGGYHYDNSEMEMHFFHTDHLGSSNYITNLAGVVTQHMEYLPFGETLVEEHLNSYNSPFKFNAKELDAETGWYYYGARYYNPKWSIWLSVDPLSERYPAWSPYAYVLHNPVNAIDPNGLTDYKINRDTGELNVVENKHIHDKTDRILKTYSRKSKRNEVKYKKNGEAKVAFGGIEKGILSEGMNFLENDNVIEVGGKGQATENGVKSFTLQLSEYIGKEIKGFSYSSDGSGNITDMLLGKYKKNDRTHSYGTIRELQNKYRTNFSFNNFMEQFHTHPDGKLGATQSAPRHSTDVKNLQIDKPYIPSASFIILYRITGQIRPAEYDYTHQYRPKKR